MLLYTYNDIHAHTYNLNVYTYMCLKLLSTYKMWSREFKHLSRTSLFQNFKLPSKSKLLKSGLLLMLCCAVTHSSCWLNI